MKYINKLLLILTLSILGIQNSFAALLTELDNFTITSDELNKIQEICNNNGSSACTALGIIYQNGMGGISQNLTKAASLYQKGCDLDDGSACTSLGLMYQNSEGVLALH